MLKKLSLIIALSFFYLSSVFAQIGMVDVYEESRSMSKGTYSALVMELPNTDKRTATKEWQTFIKKYKTNAKYDRKTDEYFSDDASIPEMSDNTVDVYARFYEQGENTLVAVWFNLGVNYLTAAEYPQRYPAGVTVLQNFASISTQSIIEAELKEQEKTLKDMEGDLGKLEKEQDGYYKDIDKQREIIREAEEAIRLSEENITKNEQDQAAKKTEIEDQKVIISDVERALEEVKARNKKKK